MSWNGNTLPFCRDQRGATVQVMRVAYHKLVRDQIPVIIAADGGQPVQKEVAERARISQPALSRIELGGGVPDIETLQRLGRAMGVRFRIIVGDENAEQEESLLVS